MNYDGSLVRWLQSFDALKMAFPDQVNLTEASWNTEPKSGIQIRIRIDPKDFQRSEPVCVRVDKPVLILDETPISEKRNQAQALFSAYCKSQGITDADIAKTVVRLAGEKAEKEKPKMLRSRKRK